MAEAAESALRFCQGRTRADVDTDDMLRFALTRAVKIVGEAANKVSIEARTQIPGIAWPAIVGMRNRLVHAYFDVDKAKCDRSHPRHAFCNSSMTMTHKPRNGQKIRNTNQEVYDEGNLFAGDCATFADREKAQEKYNH